MIQQHIYRRDRAGGYRTAAASAGLTGSAWLSLLEQQTVLRCQSYLPAPVYFQYPLGVGLVFSRCAVDPNGSRGSYLAHQLVADDPADIDLVASLRPLSAGVYQEAYVGREGVIDPLPTLKPEALADESLLSAGLKLLDGWFDEALLSRLITALFLAAKDKRHTVHLVIDQDAASASEQGRLLLELLMRALPVQDMRRISYCTLIEPGDTALPYSVCVSPPVDSEKAKDARGQCVIRFELSRRAYHWPENEPEIDARARELAQALLAHDLNWVDRVRLGGAGVKLAGSESLKLDIPDFERGMKLTQYVEDWAQAMEARRGALNDEAFRVFAGDEWPHLTERVIRAADLMPCEEFLRQLHDSIVALCKNHRGEALGMTRQNLADLIMVLLDSIRWDDIDLTDPATAKLIRSATGYADLLGDMPNDGGCLLACRVAHAMLDAPMAHAAAALDDLARLSEDYPAAFSQIQACARRYVTTRCRLARDEFGEMGLVDEPFVVTAVVGYVRFEGGIPDFRSLDKVKETVGQIGGPKSARRFEAILDRLRRRMHASRANLARQREMRFMLGVSLVLALVIAGVILGYFLFIH